jgi:DNA-binding protein HU-beta
MNKKELIDAIAAGSKLTKADSKKALDAFIKATTNSLKKGGRLALVGFGSFSVVKRSARTGRNPQTGKPISIKAKNVVKFRVSKGLLSTEPAAPKKAKKK